MGVLTVPLSDAPAAPSTTPDDPPPVGSYHFEVFFDGDCPLCRREIDFLKRLDRKERVRFTDIAAEEFDPRRYGKVMSELMAEIHGRLPDGAWVTGVEVFRRLWAAIGYGWLVGPTRLPGVRHALDGAYRVFAKNRLRLTGRCNEGACGV